MKESQDLVKAWQKRIASLEEKGRFGSPIDPRTQTPGPTEFVNEERKEEEDEESERLTGKFDEESKALLREHYLKVAYSLGYMPTLKDFRDYLGRSGVPTEEFSDDSLSDALAQVWVPHGGSDNAINLRSPGQPPAKIPASGSGGSSTGRIGSGNSTYPSNYQSMREGGYINPSAPNNKLSTGRSRGLSDSDASRQFYDSGRQEPLSGGKNRPGQAYTSYPKRKGMDGGLAPLTKAFITIANTYAEKGGLLRTEEDERDMQNAQRNAFQTMLEEEEFPGALGEERGDNPNPNVGIFEERREEESEWSDEEGQRIAGLLRREADEAEALAMKYEESLQRSSGTRRNLADEEAVKRAITDYRALAMTKRKRAYSLQKSDGLRLGY